MSLSERNGLIPMPDPEAYFDVIDAARVRRAKELSEVKRWFTVGQGDDPLIIASKATVVLSYAAWEGFFNECVHAYLDFLVASDLKVVDAGWMMLVGSLASDFEALRSRNSSRESKSEFVRNLEVRLQSTFSDFDRSVVLARSNLDFAKVTSNYSILGFDITPLQRLRLRIDKEVVGWRHGVAHGSAPDLNAMNVSAHVDFVSNLLLAVADTFQIAILERLTG